MSFMRVYGAGIFGFALSLSVFETVSSRKIFQFQDMGNESELYRDAANDPYSRHGALNATEFGCRIIDRIGKLTLKNR
jgi:hypothetical protein